MSTRQVSFSGAVGDADDWPALARRLRERYGQSRRGMARMVGISPSAWRGYENGGIPADPIQRVLRDLENACPPALPSPLERLVLLAHSQPGITVLQALAQSGATQAELEAEVDAGRLRIVTGPGPRPDRFGRQRAARRVYPVIDDTKTDLATAPGSYRASDADLVRQACGASGWNPGRVATELGITVQAVYAYRNGRQALPPLRRVEVEALIERMPTYAGADEARDRVYHTVKSWPGERPASLIDRVRKYKRFDRNRAIEGYQSALEAGLIHVDETPYTDSAGHPRIRRAVRPGRATAPLPAPAMTAEEARTRRQAAGLSQSDLAARLHLTRGAVDMMERRGPSRARSSQLRELFATIEPPPTVDPVERAKSEIRDALMTHPGIGRTELLDRRVGRRTANIQALAEMLDAGEVERRTVPHVRARRYKGLFLRGQPDAGPEITAAEIEALRERAGLTQQEAADLCSTPDHPVSKSSWRQWARGVRPVNQLLAPRIRERLGSLPPGDGAARSGAQRKPFPDTLALFVAEVGAVPGRTSAELRKACHGRRDFDEVRKYALEHDLVHVVEESRRNATGRAITSTCWYLGRTSTPAVAEVPQGAGATLKRARMAARLRQVDLSDRIGVNASTISSWERGSTLIHPAHWPAVRTFIDESEQRQKRPPS